MKTSQISQISWNLFGLVAPLVVAVLTIPALVASLGYELFGLLALAWGLIGYAGVMDLGIGRAVTQLVSKLRGQQDEASIPNVVATAGRITLVSGFVGAFVIFLVSQTSLIDSISAPSTPREQIVYSIIFLAIALPAQAMSATYRGVNEAYLQFRGISLVKTMLGVLSFGGPYFMSFFTKELHWLVFTLLVSRVISLIVFKSLAAKSLRYLNKIGVRAEYSSAVAKRLFSFGIGVGISSLLGPLLVQVDRFMIGILISAVTVTIYVLPYEIVMQSLVLVGAVTGVFFPMITQLIHSHDEEWRKVFWGWTIKLSLLMGVICIVIFFTLETIMKLWLGSTVSEESVAVGEYLIIGVFINSIGSMFYSIHHAMGRADITAMFHLLELIIFIPLLYFFINQYGVLGAAYAWIIRVIIDTLALVLSYRILFVHKTSTGVLI
jgi:O-antigen/teichoic acid export membrane protein